MLAAAALILRPTLERIAVAVLRGRCGSRVVFGHPAVPPDRDAAAGVLVRAQHPPDRPHHASRRAAGRLGARRPDRGRPPAAAAAALVLGRRPCCWCSPVRLRRRSADGPTLGDLRWRALKVAWLVRRPARRVPRNPTGEGRDPARLDDQLGHARRGWRCCCSRSPAAAGWRRRRSSARRAARLRRPVPHRHGLQPGDRPQVRRAAGHRRDPVPERQSPARFVSTGGLPERDPDGVRALRGARLRPADPPQLRPALAPRVAPELRPWPPAWPACRSTFASDPAALRTLRLLGVTHLMRAKSVRATLRPTSSRSPLLTRPA